MAPFSSSPALTAVRTALLAALLLPIDAPTFAATAGEKIE
jgi:hypothetical protein